MITQRSAIVDFVEIQETSVNRLDIVQRDSASPAHKLTRRAVNIKLMADTGSQYHISVRGVVIILHIFYDLATERARMYWSPDSSNPTPSSLKFGAYDRTRGVSNLLMSSMTISLLSLVSSSMILCKSSLVTEEEEPELGGIITCEYALGMQSGIN